MGCWNLGASGKARESVIFNDPLRFLISLLCEDTLNLSLFFKRNSGLRYFLKLAGLTLKNGAIKHDLLCFLDERLAT